jgi:hypothetical protein
MDCVSSNNKKVKIKAGHSKNKLAVEWVLDKVKLMKLQEMLEIKFNFNNKFKGIRINNKIPIIMLEKINRMTFKCKGNLMVKCLIKNKIKTKIKKINLNKEMSKWDKYKIKNVNKR